MAFTEQELKSGIVNTFDHATDPTAGVRFKSIMRVIEALPDVEQRLLDTAIDCMKEKGIWRHVVKQRISHLSKEVEKAVYAVYKDAAYEVEDKYKNEQRLSTQLFSEKIATAVMDFAYLVDNMTNVYQTRTPVEQSNYLLAKADFIGRLEQGDSFFFIDEKTDGHNLEYTVKSKAPDSKVIYFRRSNPDMVFAAVDPFRPVIKTTIFKYGQTCDTEAAE